MPDCVLISPEQGIPCLNGASLGKFWVKNGLRTEPPMQSRKGTTDKTDAQILYRSYMFFILNVNHGNLKILSENSGLAHLHEIIASKRNLLCVR